MYDDWSEGYTLIGVMGICRTEPERVGGSVRTGCPPWPLCIYIYNYIYGCLPFPFVPKWAAEKLVPGLCRGGGENLMPGGGVKTLCRGLVPPPPLCQTAVLM